MRRRRVLHTFGMGLSVGVAGCVTPGSTNSSRPGPEAFEQCEKLVVRIPTLPDPAREEVEIALNEGQYETEGELYLPHVIPVSESYLGATGGDPETDYRTLSRQDVTQHYRAVVAQDGDLNRLRLTPAVPTWGPGTLGVENETDEPMTVEISIERLRDSAFVVEERLSVPAGERIEMSSFEQSFSGYRADVRTERFSDQVEWHVSELQRPADAVVLGSAEPHVRPGTILEPVSCAEVWQPPAESA